MQIFFLNEGARNNLLMTSQTGLVVLARHWFPKKHGMGLKARHQPPWCITSHLIISGKCCLRMIQTGCKFTR
jgi:hypothetical protein